MDLAELLDEDLHDQLRTMRIDDPLVRGALGAFLVALFARHDIAVDERWIEAQLVYFIAHIRDEWPDVVRVMAVLIELEQRVLH
jgi:hypothetical protein